LKIRGIDHIPSFKNRKRAIFDVKKGHMRTLTPASVKKRMDSLENAIVSALYSACQISEDVMHSECLKRLRTALSGLCDDSIKEIPCGDWDTIYVPNGEEGADILVERLT